MYEINGSRIFRCWTLHRWTVRRKKRKERKTDLTKKSAHGIKWFHVRNIFCQERILFVDFEINFVMCEKIVVNNEIIIFRSEIVFFTNETDLAIYPLINYEHIMTTYVPCICMYYVIAVITVKIANIIIINILNWVVLWIKYWSKIIIILVNQKILNF